MQAKKGTAVPSNATEGYAAKLLRHFTISVCRGRLSNE